jgi:hypothetical protein
MVQIVLGGTMPYEHTEEITGWYCFIFLRVVSMSGFESFMHIF